MNKQIVTPQNSIARMQASQLLALGRKQGWRFGYLGRAPMLTGPFRVRDWLLVPAHLDNSPLPESAWRRVQAIYAAGIEPAGWVVAHEAPLLLAAPGAKPAQVPAAWGKLAAIGGLAGLLTYLIWMGILLDPILTAVTPAGDWIEIDRWVV